jgi:hypothetical protein
VAKKGRWLLVEEITNTEEMIDMSIRHKERSVLFSLYDAKNGGDIDLIIARTEASMEKEDVDSVRERFEQWRKSKESK